MTCKDRLEEYRRDNGVPFQMQHHARVCTAQGVAAAVLGVTEVRLAEGQEFAATFPNCEVGAKPPFGNLYGVDVYVDQTLADDETIVMQAGTHTDTLSLRYADFARLVQEASASSGGTPEFLRTDAAARSDGPVSPGAT